MDNTLINSSVNNTQKSVRTHIGITVDVPLFVSEGDKIKVSTTSLLYLGRQT